jgi:hypothetical protein
VAIFSSQSSSNFSRTIITGKRDACTSVKFFSISVIGRKDVTCGQVLIGYRMIVIVSMDTSRCMNHRTLLAAIFVIESDQLRWQLGRVHLATSPASRKASVAELPKALC